MATGRFWKVRIWLKFVKGTKVQRRRNPSLPSDRKKKDVELSSSGSRSTAIPRRLRLRTITNIFVDEAWYSWLILDKQEVRSFPGEVSFIQKVSHENHVCLQDAVHLRRVAPRYFPFS